MNPTAPYRQTLLLLLGVALCGAALANASPQAPNTGATTVYRCGQTYQQVPCKDAQVVAVSDERDAAQRRAAQQAAAAERRSANELTAERLAREKAPRPAAAHPGGATTVAAAATTPAVKHVRSKAVKHPKALEATDKTLYAPRADKKAEPEAKMPSP